MHPQTLTRPRKRLELAMKIGYQPPKAGTIRGVLVATEKNGAQNDSCHRDCGGLLGSRRGSGQGGSALRAVDEKNQEPSIRCRRCCCSRCWAA